MKCICSNHPHCVYPHVFPLGVKEIREGARENRTSYEVDITQLQTIVPKNYFLTTGDLIPKLKILERDAFALAFAVRRMRNAAKKTQGNSQFLETSMDEDGKVYVQPKTTKKCRDQKLNKSRVGGV